MGIFLRVLARCVLTCTFSLCALASSYAQTLSPEVTRGLQWLATQVQTDGSLLNEPQSIATKLQNRTEAAQTLKLLAALPPSLSAGINADTDDNTEYLSRKAIALSLNGWDATNYVGQLLQRQNADGGLGGASSHASNLLDTAWAVLALAQTNNATGATASRARAYLASQVMPDGGINARGDMNRLHQSAIALLALQTAPDGSSATAIRGLTSWILQQQGADGGWSGNVYLSAFALAAVSPVTADTTVRGNARNFLVSRQAADGSWNDDPFLTALVLRALSTQFSAPSSNGVLKGLVNDRATNAPLSGASITLSGAGNKIATTDDAGGFTINDLVPGSYSVTYTRNGYSPATQSYTVNAGQTSDAGIIGLTQLASAGIIRGQVLAANSNTPLSRVTISVSGVTTASAVTDANGRYELMGITPGAVVIAASLTGYQTTSGTATVTGGQTLVFSPTVYANNQTAPTTIRYLGKVVSAGQALPLNGVTIQIAGASNASAVTDASGRFDITLSPGSYSATFSLTGYNGVTQTFVAPGGTTVDAGTVALLPVKTVSTIKGRVTTTSNVGIAGASIQIVGTSTIVTSAADGGYTLDNISGTNLTIRASATGYNSQAVSLQLSAPTDVQQNFTLTPQNAGALSIGELAVTPTTVGGNVNVSVDTTVTNSGSSADTVVVQLQILDKDKKVIGTGIAYDANGNVIGQLNLAAGQKQDIKLVWNSAQFPPGDYVLDVRLLETGSITQATPQGNLIAERAAGITVTGQMHFTGVVTANPPVLQAGTSTAIKLSAVVQNDGNTDIPAQAFTLAVINTRDNTVVLSQQAGGNAIPVNGLQTLSFPDWTSTGSGSFRLELTAADPALGKVVGSLYVGDSAKATYTVNKLVVPAGTQSVRGTIKITGQDIVNGSISDPLAPLVKTAIQKSVTYNDREAVAWTARNQCLGCHIQTQALVGGELNRRFATFDEGQRNSIYNYLRGTQQADGSFYNQHPGFRNTSSMLNMWALDAWHDKDDVAMVLVKGADYLLSQQQADGRWDYSHPWLGGWTSATDHTALNVKSLVGLSQSLAKVPAWRLLSYQTAPYFAGSLPLSRGYLARDNAGNFYMSVLNQGKVVQIKPDGTTGDAWTGLNDPSALVQAKDGNGMLAATGNGLYRLTPGGVSTKLNSNTGLANLVYGPDGILYSGNYATNAIYRIDDSGADSIYLQNNALNGPAGFAFADNGDFFITSNTGRSVLRIKADKTIETVLTGAAFQGNPLALARYDGSWLLGTTTGIYRFDDQWKLVYSQPNRADNFLALANNTVLFTAYNQAGIQKLMPVPMDVNAKLARYAQSISKATTWMQNLDPNSSANTLALAHQLLALGEAGKFYANDTARYNAIRAKMSSIATTLKARQLANGSWGVSQGYVGDSFVTAHVGYALDYLNPSPDDPYVRKAVQWLLGRQQADGSWLSENGIFGTHLATTTWVSIWLPVLLDRLGGIDTDLSVTFPANVTMTNPDLAPSAKTVNSDGTTTYVWKMQGVTSAGQVINYDLSLANMALDEVRPVSTDAHLTFKNTFTNGVVNAPIDIPRVTASAFLGLGVATDKTAYPADTSVSISGQVTNTGAGLSSGKVQFDIYAPDNALVATVGAVPFSGVAAGASTSLAINWNTGKTLSGAGYYALGTLYDSADRLVGTARARFTISGPDAGVSGLTSRLTADKQTYLPSDAVKLSSRLTNATVNTLFNDVRITTTINNPDGSVRFAKTESLPQLAQGNLKEYSYNVPLSFAPAGQYTATLVATAADGTLLAQSSTQFNVRSTADTGSGLRATIAVSPKQVPLGDPVVLSFSANNLGNSLLANLPLKVSIVDPAAQKIIAEFPYTQSLDMGTTYNAATSWETTGAVGTTYVAVLTASIGPITLTLAQDSFILLPPPVKLDIKQIIPAENRVLVLLRCRSGEHEDMRESKRHGQDDGRIDGRATMRASDDRARHEADREDEDERDDDFKPADPCLPLRTQAIANALAAQPVPHRITQTVADFRQALRSGTYNVYWISNAQHKMGKTLTREVREAVYHGHSLITDGDPSGRNHILDSMSGVRWRGVAGMQLPVTLNGSFYPAGGTLPTAGKAHRLRLLDSAQAQATFTVNVPAHEDAEEDRDKGEDDKYRSDANHERDHAQAQEQDHDRDDKGGSMQTATIPGIVSHAYGKGQTLKFGFDLAGTLVDQASQWNDPLGASLSALTPAAASSWTPGSFLPVKTSVANLAKVVDVDVKSSLPAGAVYLGSNPVGSYDASARTLGWTFNLAEAQTKDLFLTMRLPAAAGDFTLQTRFVTTRKGVTRPYGDPLNLPITITSASQSAKNIADALGTIRFANRNESRVRDLVLARLGEAMAQFNRKTVDGYERAIRELLEITDKLPLLVSIDTAAVHHDLDRILEEAQWRWTQAAAALPPKKLDDRRRHND